MVNIWVVIGLILAGLVLGFIFFRKAGPFKSKNEEKLKEIEIEKRLTKKAIDDLEEGIKKLEEKKRPAKDVEFYWQEEE